MKLVLCFALFAGAIAQIEFVDEPESIGLGIIPALNDKNECRIIAATQGEMLVCTSDMGYLTALDSVPTGSLLSRLWVFDDVPKEGVKGDTGVAFSEASNTIIYGTTIGEGDSRICKIHALSATSDIDIQWSSESLDGGCSGAPVISSSGNYVFVTHNYNTTGTFTILDASTGKVFWQQEDEIQPLSPPGIYHNPLFGNYQGGENNDNDIVIYANKPFDEEVGVGNAGLYSFQFPIAFTGTDTDGLSVTTMRGLDGDAAWQAITAPTITDGGRRMYWGVTKSQIRGWPWLDDRDSFDRTAAEALGFERAERPLPKSQPIYAKVATTSDLDNEIILTGSAKNEFTALNRNFDKLWNLTLSSPVLHEAQVSPDNSVVYFVEKEGIAYAYNIADGTKLWDLPLGVGEGDKGYTQSLDGGTLYFALKKGVTAYKVAISDTLSDQVSPTLAPVVPPTLAPVVPPTLAPVVPPTLAPVVPPTLAPVVPPTLAPVVSPTLAPVAPPTPTLVPITPAPVEPTFAPTTSAPITPAPVVPTEAPVTAAPVTAKPVDSTSGAGVASIAQLLTLVIATALVNML